MDRKPRELPKRLLLTSWQGSARFWQGRIPPQLFGPVAPGDGKNLCGGPEVAFSLNALITVYFKSLLFG